MWGNLGQVGICVGLEILEMVILHIHDTSLIFIYTHLVIFINPDEVRYVIPIHNSTHPVRHTVIHINNTNSHLPKPRPSREKKKKSPILQTPPPAYQNHTYQPKPHPSSKQLTKTPKEKNSPLLPILTSYPLPLPLSFSPSTCPSLPTSSPVSLFFNRVAAFVLVFRPR